MADAMTKAAWWVLGVAATVVGGILGLGIWAFVEIILWITSK